MIERVGRTDHTTNKKPRQKSNYHTLILRSLSFCINYNLNPSRHAINHIKYVLPREFLPLFLCNLYYFPLIVGAPLSEPIFCSPLQHSPHILNRIQIWRAGRPRHFPDTPSRARCFGCGDRRSRVPILMSRYCTHSKNFQADTVFTPVPITITFLPGW